MTGFWNKTSALVLTLAIVALAFLLSRPVSADGSPTADFSATPTSGTEPLTVAFTDLSTSNDGIVSWLWDFGDGQTSIEQNPSHQYTQDGVYTVTLTVTETDSDSDLETKADYIMVSDTTPAADFSATPTSGTEPLTVAFTDLSTSYDGIVSWLWDFGDGQTSTQQNPSHQYTQDGVYTVMLTVTEADADHDSRTKVDYISISPASPTISSVSPNQGIQGQTLSSVTLTGTYLSGATSVSFGTGITVNSLTVNSPTQITANITIDPAAAPGARSVTVTTPGGSSAPLANTFTVNQAPPTISLVSPNHGIQGQTLSNVTLTGTYLTGATSVSFGTSITVNSLTVNSPTQITANITIDPAAAPGARSVTVTTPGGTGTLTSGFTVNQASPTISNVSPNQGIQGQTLSSVILTGTYLTGATSVSFGTGITVNSLTVNSPTQITTNITISSTATPGSRNISVTTPGGIATLTDGFTVNQALPTISNVSPNQGIQGQTLSNVTLTGTYLTGATSVSFGTSITVNSLTVNSPTQITANITIDPAAAPGARSVTVTTPGGSSAPLANAFTVNPAPPTITGVSPNQGIQGQTLSNVILTGTYLTGATSVDFGSGITATIVSIDSPTQITASITIDGTAAEGTRIVSINTPGGTATLPGGFTVTAPVPVPVPPPTITGVSPDSADQDQALDVVITGSNLSGATTVDFGAGITVTSFTVNSSTQITANITIDPAAAPGARSITVTTPGGSSAPLANAFTVNPAPPTVTSISPNQGIQGQTLNGVIITGTYFTGATSVSFGSGITVNSLDVNSPTQITANITINPAAAPGTRSITVTTPGGSSVPLANAFTVNPALPTVTSISPNQGIQGQTLNGVIITGTYLTGATSVSFGSGITVNSLDVNSPTQITANITINPAAAPGTRSITVTTPGGSSAPLANAFTVNPALPTVTSISPNQGIQGQTLNGVIITGTYLTGATSVDFGSGITATIVSIDSSTQITASLTIDGIAAEGTRIVSINTPGGTATLPGGFTVTVPVPVPSTSNNHRSELRLWFPWGNAHHNYHRGKFGRRA